MPTLFNDEIEQLIEGNLGTIEFTSEQVMIALHNQAVQMGVVPNRITEGTYNLVLIENDTTGTTTLVYMKPSH